MRKSLATWTGAAGSVSIHPRPGSQDLVEGAFAGTDICLDCTDVFRTQGWDCCTIADMNEVYSRHLDQKEIAAWLTKVGDNFLEFCGLWFARRQLRSGFTRLS